MAAKKQQSASDKQTIEAITKDIGAMMHEILGQHFSRQHMKEEYWLHAVKAVQAAAEKEACRILGVRPDPTQNDPEHVKTQALIDLALDGKDVSQLHQLVEDITYDIASGARYGNSSETLSMIKEDMTEAGVPIEDIVDAYDKEDEEEPT